MAGRLEGKAVIITGAGARGGELGNGKAAAILFAREGAKVLVTDRDPDRDEFAGRATYDAIRAEGGIAELVACDVTKPDEIKRMTELCLDRFGRIDVLYNNVGYSSPPGLFATTDEIWDLSFAVNVKSVFLTAKAAIPTMIKQGGGQIITTSSTAAMRFGTSPPYGYSASKAALQALTKCLAVEFGRHGIRCNCIIPGTINTSHVRSDVMRIGLSEAEADAFMEARDAQSPTGAQGSPWDVAEAALFLASGACDFLNGAEILIDGGVTSLSPTTVNRPKS